jgi:pterin-4a-carbinolamine dehydratase
MARQVFNIFSVILYSTRFQVTAASMHMIDRVAHWYQSYKHSPGIHTYEHFVVAVSHEYDVNTHRVKTMTLLDLKQTGSVEDYKQQFD